MTIRPCWGAQSELGKLLWRSGHTSAWAPGSGGWWAGQRGPDPQHATKTGMLVLWGCLELAPQSTKPGSSPFEGNALFRKKLTSGSSAGILM